MTTDTILHKYMRHLRYISTVPHLDAVELAFRLALEESATAAPPTASDPGLTAKTMEILTGQINRLNEWLAQYEPSEYASPGDTADAMLCVLNRQRTENAEMRNVIATLESDLRRCEGTAAVMKNPPFAPGPGDSAAPSAISNQQSPINNQPPPNPPPAPLPLDLSSLAPDELGQVVAVQSGERAWRTLNKPLRMKVARLTLRHLSAAKGSLISMKHWDEQRPSWMPTQGAICQMFKCKWHEIILE